MATKVRLLCGGYKSYTLYSIVITDTRAPRDGRFTGKTGIYNPNINPATIYLNFGRALYWVETDAQPTDTTRNILKSEGVYTMKHLRGGVKKGTSDEATCQQELDVWKQAKVAAAEAVEKKVTDAKRAATVQDLEAEKKVNKVIAKKVTDKKAVAVAAQVKAEATQVTGDTTPEAPVEEAPVEAQSSLATKT